MGELRITGINGTEHIERLRALLDFILAEGREGEIINDSWEWDFTPEFPSDDELYYLVDPYDERCICRVWQHRWGCECRWQAVHTDPRQTGLFESLPDEDRYYPLAACPSRGTHAELQDCAICFADVATHRAEEADVLVTGSHDAGDPAAYESHTEEEPMAAIRFVEDLNPDSDTPRLVGWCTRCDLSEVVEETDLRMPEDYNQALCEAWEAAHDCPTARSRRFIAPPASLAKMTDDEIREWSKEAWRHLAGDQ